MLNLINNLTNKLQTIFSNRRSWINQTGPDKWLNNLTESTIILSCNMQHLEGLFSMKQIVLDSPLKTFFIIQISKDNFYYSK